MRKLQKSLSLFPFVCFITFVFFPPPISFAQVSSNQGLHVVGNHFVDGSGNIVILRGASRWSLEFSCGDGHFTVHDFQAMRSWGMNLVRIPLNENYFFHPEFCGGAYQITLFQAVENAERAGLYVLLDLHWTYPPIHNRDNRGGQFPMPNTNSIVFWTILARKYAHDPRVLFEPMNEPHDVSCFVWQNGGSVHSQGGTQWIQQTTGDYRGVGFQTLVNVIRTVAPNNVIIQGTSNEADVSCVRTNALEGTNIAYQAHFYETNPIAWKNDFSDLLAQYPIIAGEFDTRQGANVVSVFEGFKTGYLGWTWQGCSDMTSNCDGTPSPGWKPIHDFMLAAANRPCCKQIETEVVLTVKRDLQEFSLRSTLLAGFEDAAAAEVKRQGYCQIAELC